MSSENRTEREIAVGREIAFALYRYRVEMRGHEQSMDAAVRPLVERIMGLEASTQGAETERWERRSFTLEAEIKRLEAALDTEQKARADMITRHAKEREDHAKIESALRTQLAGLEAIMHGQEAAIVDACADVRSEMARELASTSSALERAVRKIARLETTIGVLVEMAGRREN